MKLIKLITVFLVLNFGALAIGNWFMNNGPQTEWYQNLNKAPWTPPGWVFGVAWTLIMICFSIYMAQLYNILPTKRILVLFAIQFLCNVSWNYIFFNQHFISLGLFVIVLLTLIISYFLISYYKTLKLKSVFIMPYFIWLCIATSLNAYILINN